MDALFAPPSPLLFGDEDIVSFHQAQGLGSGLLQPINSAVKPLNSFMGAASDIEVTGFGDDTYERLLPSLQAAGGLDSQPDAADAFVAGKRKGFTSDQLGMTEVGTGLTQSSSNKLARLQNFDDDDDIVVTSGNNGAGLLFPGYTATSASTTAAASSLAWPIHGVASQRSAVLQHPAVQAQAGLPEPAPSRAARSVPTSQHPQATSRALSTISEESDGRSSIAIDGVGSVLGVGVGRGGGSPGTGSSPSTGYLLQEMPGMAAASSRSAHMLQHVQEDAGLDDAEDDDDDEGEEDMGGMWGEGEGEEEDATGPALLGADEELLVVLPRPLVATLGKKGRLPFTVAYSRGRLVTGCAYSVGLYGVLNGQRASRIAAFDALRARRIFYKKVKYTQRHSLANGRQRIKGRFVKDDTPGAAPPKAAGKR